MQNIYFCPSCERVVQRPENETVVLGEQRRRFIAVELLQRGSVLLVMDIRDA